MLSNYVNEKNLCMFLYVFQKQCWFRATKLFECQKKYIWNAKYTIQHRIERSQTTKCIQYNIHDTISSELPKYFITELYRENSHTLLILSYIVVDQTVASTHVSGCYHTFFFFMYTLKKYFMF